MFFDCRKIYDYPISSMVFSKVCCKLIRGSRKFFLFQSYPIGAIRFLTERFGQLKCCKSFGKKGKGILGTVVAGDTYSFSFAIPQNRQLAKSHHP